MIAPPAKEDIVNILDTGKKYGITGALTLVMIVVAVCTNQLTDKNPHIVTKPGWCHHSKFYQNQKEKFPNLTNGQSLISPVPTMPRGLAETTGVLCFFWPLLPLLLNSRNTFTDAKGESIMAHLLGQSSNFGIAEIFQTQIELPEDLFLEKCNISPKECLRLSQEKIPRPLYVSSKSQLPPVCKGQHFNSTTAFQDEANTLFQSLHHYPDTICMLFGASVVTFLTGLCRWRDLNPTKKKLYDASTTVRNLLTISDVATLACVLCYFYFLCVTYDLAQLAGVFVGVLLQLFINRTISYRQPRAMEKCTDIPQTTTGDFPTGVDTVR